MQWSVTIITKNKKSTFTAPKALAKEPLKIHNYWSVGR